eukprot:4735069-Ditylum_brightwellii.AAC.1
MKHDTIKALLTIKEKQSFLRKINSISMPQLSPFQLQMITWNALYRRRIQVGYANIPRRICWTAIPQKFHPTLPPTMPSPSTHG